MAVKKRNTTKKVADPVAKEVEVKVEEVVETVEVKEEVKAEEVVEAVEVKEEVKTEEAVEVKAPAKKAAAKTTKKAAKKEVKTSVLLQFAGQEVSMDTLVENAKKAFEAAGNDVSEINEIQIYVKPEEYKAYYVINGITGEIYLF